MTIIWAPVYPAGIDTFTVPANILVDNVDEVIANHPNSLAHSIVEIETKLGITDGLATAFGGLSFTPLAAYPGIVGQAGLYVDSATAPNSTLYYIDESGVAYNLSGFAGLYSLQSAYDGGNAINISAASGGPITITIPDTENEEAIYIVNNDDTNDPDSFVIENNTDAASSIFFTGTKVDHNVVSNSSLSFSALTAGSTVITYADGNIAFQSIAGNIVCVTNAGLERHSIADSILFDYNTVSGAGVFSIDNNASNILTISALGAVTFTPLANTDFSVTASGIGVINLISGDHIYLTSNDHTIVDSAANVSLLADDNITLRYDQLNAGGKSLTVYRTNINKLLEFTATGGVTYTPELNQNYTVTTTGTGNLVYSASGSGNVTFTSASGYEYFNSGGAIRFTDGYYTAAGLGGWLTYVCLSNAAAEWTTFGGYFAANTSIIAAINSSYASGWRYFEQNAVGAGTVTLDTFNPTEDGSCMWYYSCHSTTNHRAGILYAVWDDSAGTVEYSEQKTDDLGNTADVTFVVNMSGGSGSVRVQVTVAGASTWDLKIRRAPTCE